jgi:hypothetical protein
VIAIFTAIDVFAAALCVWVAADRDTYRPKHRRRLLPHALQRGI